MKEKEFNLLNEPWVLLMRFDGGTDELSLKDVFLHAHQYKRLAGETPFQDVAMLRLWLMERAERYGFLLKTDDFDVVDTRWYRFKKRGQHEITLRTATFEGTLQITNAEQFIQTLINGVGREKAYGCGLLTIAKQR